MSSKCTLSSKSTHLAAQSSTTSCTTSRSNHVFYFHFVVLGAAEWGNFSVGVNCYCWGIENSAWSNMLCLFLPRQRRSQIVKSSMKSRAQHFCLVQGVSSYGTRKPLPSLFQALFEQLGKIHTSVSKFFFFLHDTQCNASCCYFYYKLRLQHTR